LLSGPRTTGNDRRLCTIKSVKTRWQYWYSLLPATTIITMADIADDLVYDYLKKHSDRFPRALASFERSTGKANEGKCAILKDGSRMARAQAGAVDYGSKVEVLVDDFASRYGGKEDGGDSKTKSAYVSSKPKFRESTEKNPQIPTFEEKPEKSINPFEFTLDNGNDDDEDAFQIDWAGSEKPGASAPTAKLGDPGNQHFLDAVTFSLEQAQGNCPGASGRLIRIEDAKTVRMLIFGGKRGTTFNEAWREQGLFFSANESAGFGLVQKNGGPCGVLASIQATIIRRLLFGIPSRSVPPILQRRSGDESWKCPSPKNLIDALVGGIVDLIMMACLGDDGKTYKRPIVVLPRNNGDGDSAIPRQTATYKADGLTEEFEVYTLTNAIDLELFLRAHLDAFVAPDGPGAVMVAVSAILSRGLSNLTSDMDTMVDEPSLIGGHNYANQEFVNLMLVGRAHSNIFDGERDMDGLKLRGIPRPPLVGFLTLFEHFGHVECGDFYKNPAVPVWVVCSESHYTVLFTLEEDLTAPQLECYYYDELASQETLYRLTLRMDNAKVNRDDLVPPIDDVLRTRWKGASVDWNGVEPLL
jgi:hypothetical protein